MTPSIHDRIAGLKAEAKHFRDLAAMKRRVVAELKARPIGNRDPIGVLKAQERITEYVRAAQDRDAACVELRAQLGLKPRAAAAIAQQRGSVGEA